jgi:hypothetical protein
MIEENYAVPPMSLDAEAMAKICVIYVRKDDAWSLGAPREFIHQAWATWSDCWDYALLRRSDHDWEKVPCDPNSPPCLFCGRPVPFGNTDDEGRCDHCYDAQALETKAWRCRFCGTGDPADHSQNCPSPTPMGD